MKRRAKAGSAGFSLLEALIAVFILTVIMVAIFREVNRSQTYYRVEDQRTNLTRDQREFVDTFTRDLHQAGYPSPVSTGQVAPKGGFKFTGLTANSNFPTVVEMQGDLGDGNGVSTVNYTYNAAAGTITRAVGGVATTSVENVTAAAFTAFDNTGTELAPPVTLANVRSIRVTLTTQSGEDATNKRPIQMTMTGMARLPNND